MPNITLSVPNDLKMEMDRFSEVSWSDVCRNAIRNYMESRGSVNPLARSKFLELKERERGLGYKFGLKIAEELVEIVSYEEIRQLMVSIHYWEHVGYPDDFIGCWIVDNFESEYYKDYMEMFEDYSKKKGNFAWLLKLSSNKEDFHKNMIFIDGLLKGLHDLFEN